jgi:membrane-associated phospholipid phosphatase
MSYDRTRIAQLDLLTRGALGAAALICVGAQMFSPIRFDLDETALPLAAFVAMVAIAIIYGRWRGAPRIAAAAALSADFIAAGLVLAAASYLAVAGGRPMAAQAFIAADRALGFDWPAYEAFVSAHPALQATLSFAYQTMGVQLAVLVCALILLDRHAQLRLLTDVFILSALVVIFFSWLFPAVDADIMFGKYRATQTAAGLWSTGGQRADDFLNLHYGLMTSIPVMNVTGLVTFPSFHTVCAILFAITAAQFPAARVPALVVNILMIAATPVEGGHYLVDVIAGAAICMAVHAAATAWAAERGPARTEALATA